MLGSLFTLCACFGGHAHAQYLPEQSGHGADTEDHMNTLVDKYVEHLGSVANRALGARLPTHADLADHADRVVLSDLENTMLAKAGTPMQMQMGFTRALATVHKQLALRSSLTMEQVAYLLAATHHGIAAIRPAHAAILVTTILMAAAAAKAAGPTAAAVAARTLKRLRELPKFVKATRSSKRVKAGKAASAAASALSWFNFRPKAEASAAAKEVAKATPMAGQKTPAAAKAAAKKASKSAGKAKRKAAPKSAGKAKA